MSFISQFCPFLEIVGLYLAIQFFFSPQRKVIVSFILQLFEFTSCNCDFFLGIVSLRYLGTCLYSAPLPLRTVRSSPHSPEPHTPDRPDDWQPHQTPVRWNARGFWARRCPAYTALDQKPWTQSEIWTPHSPEDKQHDRSSPDIKASFTEPIITAILPWTPR